MRSTVLASRLVTTLSAQIALALSGFPILSAYATEPSQSEIQQQVSRARLAARVANDLGVRTFLKLQIVNSGQNSLLSPMSLAIACALIADGCNGLTRDKLARAIVSDGVLLADGNWKALRTLLLAKRNGVEQTLATALFADHSVKFEPTFVKNATKNFSAECISLAFDSPSALEAINSWISINTNGRLKSSLTNMSPADVLLLTTLYFKAVWTDKFETVSTHQASFTLPSGKTKQVQMMSKSFDDHPCHYYANDEVQVVELPYGNPESAAGKGRIPQCMYIFLPRKNDGLQALCAKLTAAKIDQWIAQLGAKNGELFLPRFSVSGTNSLKPVLSSMACNQFLATILISVICFQNETVP